MPFEPLKSSPRPADTPVCGYPAAKLAAFSHAARIWGEEALSKFARVHER